MVWATGACRESFARFSRVQALISATSGALRSRRMARRLSAIILWISGSMATNESIQVIASRAIREIGAALGPRWCLTAILASWKTSDGRGPGTGSRRRTRAGGQVPSRL